MKSHYYVLGLMSGSSLDGLDLALCHFEKTPGRWEYDVVAAQTFPYHDALRSQLAKAIELPAYEFKYRLAQVNHHEFETKRSRIFDDTYNHTFN